MYSRLHNQRQRYLGSLHKSLFYRAPGTGHIGPDLKKNLLKFLLCERWKLSRPWVSFIPVREQKINNKIPARKKTFYIRVNFWTISATLALSLFQKVKFSSDYLNSTLELDSLWIRMISTMTLDVVKFFNFIFVYLIWCLVFLSSTITFKIQFQKGVCSICESATKLIASCTCMGLLTTELSIQPQLLSNSLYLID